MSEESTHRSWGSTAEERAATYRCDELLPEAEKSMWRAIDVDAPPEVVFRWLCQLKAAPYSYDILDNLGRRSPRDLTPGLEDLEAGQKALMIYEIVDFEEGKQITFMNKQLRGMFGTQCITYEVQPRGAGGSRLIAKRRLKPPGLPHGPLIKLNLPVIDFIMTRKQLLTLKKLAEKQTAETPV